MAHVHTNLSVGGGPQTSPDLHSSERSASGSCENQAPHSGVEALSWKTDVQKVHAPAMVGALVMAAGVAGPPPVPSDTVLKRSCE